MNNDVKPRWALTWRVGAVVLALALGATVWMNANPTPGRDAAMATPSANWPPQTAPGALPAGAEPGLAAAPPLLADLPAASGAAAAAALKPSWPGAQAPQVPDTDCKALVQAHAQASAVCARQPEAAACVRQTLQAQGLNADAMDLCKLFRPGLPSTQSSR